MLLGCGHARSRFDQPLPATLDTHPCAKQRAQIRLSGQYQVRVARQSQKRDEIFGPGPVKFPAGKDRLFSDSCCQTIFWLDPMLTAEQLRTALIISVVT